ncbi:PAS domain S-box protein [Pelomonas sp. SE-A7]|uniref:hybrid sensor histidine kinase/response regulator n=1 Tax=Pelomonas sp. SE-A7 TaxID=3054953 RepID=UPI00259D0533|nr:PAS domain S-box protein [Pelomonas sp. SE-A7]MDM4764758.1 PAS domain S-box protein [Pelomonas sp. SE-A7]
MADALPLRLPTLPGCGSLEALGQVTLPMLTALLDQVPARVVALDHEERLVYANDEFFRFTGLAPAQVLGQHIARIIGSAAYGAYQPLKDQLRRGESVGWEGWIELAARGRRYMREHLIPTGPPEDPLRSLVIISLDWTALQQRDAELSAKLEELETTQALKASIVDHALAALVSTDEHGLVVEFNPAAEAMFGIRREQALGQLVAALIIPERYRQAHNEGMARLAGGGAARVIGRRIEMSALRADGTEFPIEMVLWRTSVAGRAYFTASMADLTERRNAQAEIERQREALRQSEKLTAMGSLLAGVAHELNNPLAIVMGRAALLEEKLHGHALAGDALRIHEAAERCGRIVRTFLNMARQRPTERSMVALNEMVRAAVELMHYSLRSHGIEVQLALTPELPQVHADPDQIGQLVLNLLVNAQQAMAASEGRTRSLSISSGLEDRRLDRAQRIWLRVQDSGRGVPTELQEKIFAPFFTTKADGAGTGMGLSVSRSIAREHGGSLVLESSSDSGASFRLSLPVSGLAEVVTAPTPLEALDQGAEARVLVVDDEAEIADLMRAFLEGAGFEVATAESGAVALALLQEAQFDLIVSDLRMPDMDGTALWRAVSELSPTLARRMVFVTGDTLSATARSFLDKTRCPSLDKPFTKPELLAAVRRQLEGDKA